MASSRLLANLPNLITLARLLMTPLAVSMIVSQRFAEAFVIFVLAGASDAVDGFIAKRFDLRSELGSYLDPLADKALLISMYVALAAIGALSPALAILVVSRDLMILFAVLVSWLLANPDRDPPGLDLEIQHRRADRLRRFRARLQGLRLRRTDRAAGTGADRRRLDAGLRRRLYRAMARPHEPLRFAP